MALLETIALPLYLRKAELLDGKAERWGKHPQKLCHSVLVTMSFKSSSWRQEAGVRKDCCCFAKNPHALLQPQSRVAWELLTRMGLVGAGQQPAGCDMAACPGGQEGSAWHLVLSTSIPSSISARQLSRLSFPSLWYCLFLLWPGTGIVEPHMTAHWFSLPRSLYYELYSLPTSSNYPSLSGNVNPNKTDDYAKWNQG